MTVNITNEQFKSLTSAQNFAVRGALEVFRDVDFTKGYEMDRLLKDNPELLEEFVKDPEKVAKREVGLEPPKGFHMHFINENNEYMPPEGDSFSQIANGEDGKPWSRIEIRTGFGPLCYAFCGTCNT